MNADDKFLVVFSIAFVVVMVCTILIPFFAKKQELFGFWSFFLLGAAVFTGLSGLNAADSGFPHASVQSIDYQLHYVGVIVFFGAVAFSYYFFKTPRRLAGRVWRKWPVYTPTWMAHSSLIMLAFAATRFFPIPIPFVGQVHFHVANQAPIVALMLAMCAWWRQRTNAYFALVLIAALVFMPVATISAGGGRRQLLAGLLCLPVAIYWLDLRYRSISTRLFWISLAVGIGMPVLMGYSAIRHSERGKTGIERAVVLLQKLPEKILSGGSTEGLFGQNSVQVGITLINLWRTESDVISPVPFFSLYYTAVNPIPRAVWPERVFGGPKPEGLGHTLPRDLGVYRTGGYVNWGINVVGKCYHDGGLHVHLLYGIAVGLLIRFADEMLVRKPGNPFVLSLLAGSSAQVIAWTRGSIEGFSIQIIAVILAIFLLSFMLRLVTGVGAIEPRTDHIDDPKQVDMAMRALALASRRASR